MGVDYSSMNEKRELAKAFKEAFVEQQQNDKKKNKKKEQADSAE